MKKPAELFLYLLFLLAFSCKEKEEEFNIFFYDGAYPRNMDGTVIKTYTPEIIGGEIEAKFNGHKWNHAPYLVVQATDMEHYRSKDGERRISVSIGSMMDHGYPGACIFESYSFNIPPGVGVTQVNKSIGSSLEDARFTSINCDAMKDHYKLDKNKPNTINVISYDQNSRELRAEFDVSFVIKERNSNFGPIYPKHVRIQGRIKTIATKK